jgi:hypothetical protein
LTTSGFYKINTLTGGYRYLKEKQFFSQGGRDPNSKILLIQIQGEILKEDKAKIHVLP